jgi:alanine-synthesizing transaminase
MEMAEFPRIKRLPPYVFNITGELKMAARRRGEDIIDMSMGNPDGPTPQHIVDKLVEAVQRPDTHGYSVSKGIPAAQARSPTGTRRRYGVSFDPDRGDRHHRLQGGAGAPDAGHARPRRHRAGAQPQLPDPHLRRDHRRCRHPLGADDAGHRLLCELERAIRESLPKPKMMIIGFPSNPTAQCVDLPFSSAWSTWPGSTASSWCTTSPTPTSSFDGYKAPSIMQVPGARDVAVEFFTMSKSYNMAGWRIGFMVGNRDLVAALARIKSYHDYGTFTPVQVASIAALEGPQDCVEEVRREYQKRRDVLVKGLHEAGWMVEVPKASMYIWAEIPPAYKAMGSLEFAKKVLERGQGCRLAGHRLR